MLTKKYSRRSSFGLQLSVIELKNQLKSILFDHRGIGQAKVINKENFIRIASRVPIFLRSKKIAKFILLAAQHDSQPDPNRPGFLTNGVRGVHSSFTYENYTSDVNHTLEHIAPQQRGEWHQDLYDDPNSVHLLGNLILLPIVENSILNNRPWHQKRAIFKALCMSLPNQREVEINRIISNLKPSAIEKIKNARYMPTLDTLSRVEDWNLEFINTRTQELLSRAYDNLIISLK